MDVGEFGYAMSPDLHNAWTTPGQITDVPRLDNNSGHATSIGQSSYTLVDKRKLLEFAYCHFGLQLA